MEQEQNDGMEIDILELLFVLRQKAAGIVMAAVIAAALFGFGTLVLIAPKYQSSSKLYIVGQNSGITSLTDLQMGSQLTQDYIVLVQSRPVIERVINNLGIHLEYEELLDMIALNNESDTRILTITVTADDPYMAKEIVDEVADVSRQRIASIMNIGEPAIVESGHLENRPSSPDARKNIMFGALLGAFLGVAVAVASYLLNDLISTEEDIEKYLGLNTLGIIPVEEGAERQMMIDRRKRRGRMHFGRDAS